MASPVPRRKLAKMAKCSLLEMIAFEVVSPSGQSKGRLRNAIP